MDPLIWLGIALCLSQSAMFSGLNLAVFSISRLRLEVDAANGNRDAARVLALRQDSNFTLVTILWGNVSINVLLTLLSNSVLSGVAAFFFSTVVITLAGEIVPQAYFSRHAVRVAARFRPLLRFYQYLLYPMARPTAWLLDAWLGHEGIALFRERDFRALITRHVEAVDGDLSQIEGVGALNFLDLDDIAVAHEGEPLDPRSIVSLPTRHRWPVLPDFTRSPEDPFLKQVQASGRKWVVITDAEGQPVAVLDAHQFLRGALFQGEAFKPHACWHRPILVRDPRVRLGDVIGRMRVQPQSAEDDVIDEDLILLWTPDQKRIITGSDLLGRLLRGIARRDLRTTSS